MASKDQQRPHDESNDLENFTNYWRKWHTNFLFCFGPKISSPVKVRLENGWISKQMI